MIWLGEHPLTIGEADEETGKVLREYTIMPGEVIPVEARKLIMASTTKPDMINNKGQHSPEVVKEFYEQRRKQKAH